MVEAAPFRGRLMPMHVHVVSSLTADDEDRFALLVLETLARMLDALPVTYAIRIDTASEHFYARSTEPQRRHSSEPEPGGKP
jgi:hypothetical protein